MKADILVKDANDSSCVVTIFYTKFGFDSWTCAAKPIGPSTSGDCSRFGVQAIHLSDGKAILNMDFGARMLAPELQVQAGGTGGGWVHSDGFLISGDITWEVWNTRRTGDFGDKWVDEGNTGKF